MEPLLVGAWRECSGSDTIENEFAMVSLYLQIPESEHEGKKRIARWNEDPSRHLGEVLEVLDRAIEDAERNSKWREIDSNPVREAA